MVECWGVNMTNTVLHIQARQSEFNKVIYNDVVQQTRCGVELSHRNDIILEGCQSNTCGRPISLESL